MVSQERRQEIRKTILSISFLLFPITYYYFSPYLIVEGASNGIISGSFLVFTTLFFSALCVGRAFCGWLCPAGGMQRLCFRVNNKRFKVGRRDWVKYLIWVPWMSIIGFMFIRAGEIASVDPLYQTYYGISISNIESAILFLLIAGSIVAVAIIAGKRGFCHYACWMAPFMIIGRRIRNRFKWSSLHIEVDRARCTRCKRCDRECPMSLEVSKMVEKGSMENTECILCGTCVDVCPNEVKRFVF